LLSNPAIVEQLHSCIQQDRAVKAAGREAERELVFLNNDISRFANGVRRLEDRIMDIEVNRKVDEAHALPGLYEELEEKRKKHDIAFNERIREKGGLEDKRREQRMHVHDLLGAFEKILVSVKAMQPPEDDPSERSIVSTFSGPSIRTALSNESQHPFEPSDEDFADRGISPTEEQAEEKQKQVLINNYAQCRMIYHVEADAFDDREDQAYHLTRQRRERIDAGDQVESQLDFDLKQLETTRNYTQRLIEAEANFEAAKAAAVAAGVQVPGSEISSGFVDNDGDRLSADEEEELEINPARIDKWVACVKDAQAFYDPEDICDLSQDTIFDIVEVDDWDAQSIDIPDSMSMVADGSYRKRIDRWRRACGADA
jgi:hypothetical protein